MSISTWEMVSANADESSTHVGMVGGRWGCHRSADTARPHSWIAGHVSPEMTTAPRKVLSGLPGRVVEDSAQPQEGLGVDQDVRHDKRLEAEVSRCDRLGQGANAELEQGSSVLRAAVLDLESVTSLWRK